MYRERHKGPVALVVECPGGVALATRELPILTEFPLVEATSHSTDSSYPSLQWQPRAARIAAMRIVAARDWLKVCYPLEGPGEGWGGEGSLIWALMPLVASKDPLP